MRFRSQALWVLSYGPVPLTLPAGRHPSQVQSQMDQTDGKHRPERHTDQRGERVSGWGALGTYLLTQDKQGQPGTEQKGGSHGQKETTRRHM